MIRGGYDKRWLNLMEVARTSEEIDAFLNSVKDSDVTVAHRPIDGGIIGFTVKHNGSKVHLGIKELQPNQIGEGLYTGEARLYVDPLPEGGQPLSQVLREAFPSNCALISLPDHKITRDLVGRDQAEWSVYVVGSGRGVIRDGDWRFDSFAVIAKPPFSKA